MKWNLLRDEAYSIAVSHGWHDEEKSNEHWLMLIVTELCEAVEADRKKMHAQIDVYRERAMHGLRELKLEADIQRKYEFSLFEDYIKDTVEDELADVVIRFLDFSGLKGLNLESVDRMKDDEYYVDCPEVIEEFADQTFTEVSYELCDMLFRSLAYPFELSERRLKRFLCYLMFYCHHKGIEIEWYIEQKMEYNKQRPFKHNKEY